MSYTPYYITPRCEEEAQEHGLYPNLLGKAKKIAKNSELRSTYGFPGNYFKIIARNNVRIIGQTLIIPIDGENTECDIYLRVFPRGDRDYDEFQKNSTTETKRGSLVGLGNCDPGEVEKAIRLQQAKPEEIIVEKPQLSEEEAAFLDDIRITHKIFDVPIYESIEWIQSITKDQFSDWFKVAERLEEYIYDSEISKAIAGGELAELPYGNDDKKILIYRFYRFEGKDAFFLLGLGTDSEIEQFHQKWEERLNENKINLQTKEGRDAIVRTCRRAYPLSLLDDKDRWMEQEKDIRSNFHLSDEEMKIMTGTIRFPLFINGRAGSGKSTVLQYLFAEYLLRYLAHREVAPPLYLSYSTNLIENAKSLSRSLFNHNSAYKAYLNTLKENGKEIGAIEPHFQDVFFVFQELIRQCIGTKNKEVLGTRFARGEKYINYSKFQRMWRRKFGKDPKACKNYGPAISWHVIRSYIKGWDCEDFCDPEQYQKIGARNQTVSEEIFHLVFQKVWDEWYCTLRDDGYWDDLDLVRYALSPDDNSLEIYVEQKFSAVFCDESQDFTRVELEFILQSSIFSQRKIFDGNQFSKLPFVFVGDEFQTVNPTGFSWDTLRSYFTTRLIHSTEFGAKHGAPDPISLTKNYRSTEPIVKLGNRLQLLRQTRFNAETEILPQSPNFADQKAEPVYCLSPTNKEVWEKLKEVQAVLIVPSEDGQTVKEYIESSPIREYIEFYEDGSPVGITIYNPLQAKGLEYGVVAVYGFGDREDFNPSALKKFFSKETVQDKKNQEIHLKYFLNNAYVSITRAQKQLFIIDKMVDHETSFWDFAFSDSRTQREVDIIEEQMLSRIRNREFWVNVAGQSVLGLIVAGSIANFSGDMMVTDPIENAKKSEEQGLALEDSSIMRMAAARYRERGKKDDALRCDAFAEQFAGNYLEAGDNFTLIKQFKDAVRCYWFACAEESNLERGMESLAGLIKEQNSALEVQIAVQYQKNQPVLEELARIINQVHDILIGFNPKAKNGIYESSIQWRFIFNRLLKKFKIDPTKLTKPQKDKMLIILALCEKLAKEELPLDLDIQAEWFFQLGDMPKALERWDKLDAHGKATQNKNYYIAKVSTVPYPDNLKYWTHVDEWERNVIAEYRKTPPTDLSLEQELTVARAAIKSGLPEEVQYFLPKLLLSHTNFRNALESLNTAFQQDKTIPRNYVEALLQCKLQESVSAKLLAELRKSKQTAELLLLIESLVAMRSTTFKDDLMLAFKSDYKRYREVLYEKFGHLSRTFWNAPLLSELGDVFEKRGHSFSTMLYYQWAEAQTDDPALKRALAIRWIVYKEEQAEHENSELLHEEARVRRKEVGIGFYDEIPRSLQFAPWDSLLRKLLTFSEEQQEDSIEKESVEKTVERITPPLKKGITPMKESITSQRPKKYFAIDLFGYSIRYNPSIPELIISYKTEEEDLRICIQNGSFPPNSDFVIKGGKLLKSSGEPTGFNIRPSSSNSSAGSPVLLTHSESNIELRFF